MDDSIGYLIFAALVVIIGALVHIAEEKTMKLLGHLAVNKKRKR